MEKKKTSHPLLVAISGPLTFDFVPFADSLGICVWVIGHYYEAGSSLLSQWLLDGVLRWPCSENIGQMIALDLIYVQKNLTRIIPLRIDTHL